MMRTPSISGDGRVTNWIIVRTALWWEDKMAIAFTQATSLLSSSSPPLHLLPSSPPPLLFFSSSSSPLHLHPQSLANFDSPDCLFDGARALAFKPDDERLFLVGGSRVEDMLLVQFTL